jgi:hypothetical protein
VGDGSGERGFGENQGHIGNFCNQAERSGLCMQAGWPLWYGENNSKD